MMLENANNKEITVIFNSAAQEDKAALSNRILSWEEVEDVLLNFENPRAAVVTVKDEENVPAVRDRLQNMKKDGSVRAVFPPLKYLGLYD